MHFPAEHHLTTDLSRLPVAPHVLFEVIGLCNEADVLSRDILPVIRKDPVLTARLASLRGNHRERNIVQLADADPAPLPDLIPGIRAIASSAAVQQYLSPFNEEYTRLWADIWMNGLTCAHLSRQLSLLTGQPNPEDAFLAGLLHQLGRMVYLASDADNYALMLNGASSIEALLGKEQKRYGMNSPELSAALLQRWNPTGFLGDAVRYQNLSVELLHDAASLVKLLNLTSGMCSHMLLNGERPEQISDPVFGLESSELDNQVAEAMASAMAEARDIGMEVEETRNGPRACIDSEQIRESLGLLVREAALQESIQFRTAQSADLAELKSNISESINILFDLPSVLCFIPDYRSNSLHLFRSGDNRLEAPDLSVSLMPQRSLISESALKKRLYLSSHQDIFTQLPVIDRQIGNLLQAEAFACLPLVHQQRVYAVLAIGCSTRQASSFHQEPDVLLLFARATARLFASQILVDATHQEQLEQQQQEAHLRLRKIIHEVNNPLTIVTNYLEILSPALSEHSENRQHLETIQSEIERVADILQRFREESQGFAKDQSMVYINQQVTKILDFFEPTLHKKNRIKSVLRLDPSDPAISTDAIKLKQIITNILKNAVEALTDKGQITITTRGLVFMNNEQFVEISISDNGKGLPVQVIENLYSPVESGKGPDHSGLGLAIVYKLVSELRGMIRYNRSTSGGAEFTLLLPRT